MQETVESISNIKFFFEVNNISEVPAGSRHQLQFAALVEVFRMRTPQNELFVAVKGGSRKNTSAKGKVVTTPVENSKNIEPN